MNLFKDEFTRDHLLNTRWTFEETGERFLRRMIIDDNAICILAEQGEQIVAYLIGCLLPIDSVRPVKRAELANMYVEKKWRNQGLGTKMIHQFLEWSKRRGATHAVVGAQWANENAIKVYKKSGFHPYHLRLEMEL